MKRRDNKWDGGGAVGGIGSICGSAVWSWVHDKVMVEPMAVKFLRLCTSKIDHYVHLVKIMKTLNMCIGPMFMLLWVTWKFGLKIWALCQVRGAEIWRNGMRMHDKMEMTHYYINRLSIEIGNATLLVCYCV